MSDPDFAGANTYARQRLAELPTILTYHNRAHTCDDVVPAVAYLVAQEGVAPRDTELVRTAAFFHDLGFTMGPQDHEAGSVHIAGAILPQYGFRPTDIEAIAGMIFATRLPQQPHTLLEMILADADLDVLGRDDFPLRHAALRAEVTALGGLLTDRQWYCAQWRFLVEHRYFTVSAHERRADRKQGNLAYLANYCAAADTD
jgi:uncharacterized protein